jgi:molybdopterin converting factor small subunit
MIRVTLLSSGPMLDYFGERELLELPDGATLGDLLERIGAEHGERLAGSIWNRKEGRFRGPVVIMVGGRAVKDRATPLQDQAQVNLIKAVVGG